MMARTDWHMVALSKLTKVMGDRAGRELMSSVLGEVGLGEISCARELRIFADALASRDGFAAPLGSLLRLHVTLNDPGSSTD